MTCKFLIIFLIGVLVFSITTFAYDIKQFDTDIEVYDDGVAKVTHDIVLDTTNINNAFLIPTNSPYSSVVNDEEGELKFAVLGNHFIIQPRKQTKEYYIYLDYLTNSITSKKEDEWSLNYQIPAYGELKISDMGESRLVISFPNTATITSFSEGGIIFTEDALIKIGWKLKLEKENPTDIRVKYANTATRKTDYIEIAFYALITLIAVVLVFFCIKKGYCKLTKRVTKGKKDIMRTMGEREKEIIRLLIENNNKLYQSKIQKETSISKATLSRIIKRLENSNVIEVRPSGNTNLILLQEWFVKK